MTKILFITSTRIGDAVLSTGLIDHILKICQDPRLTIVCGPLPASLFEGVPHLDRLIILKKQKRNKHWWDLWREVGFTRWDIVIDLRNSIVSRLIFANEKHIHGHHVDGKLHKVAQNAAVMRLDTIPAPRLFLTEAQKERAKQLVPEGAQVLAIGPTANWIGKTWPADRFIEVIEKLTAQDGIMPGARVAVFAAPGEEDAAYQVLNSVAQNRRIDCIAKGSPGEAAAALARCDFYIGNDSGLMHAAAAAGIPTLGLFGASYVDIYGPYGEKTEYAHTPQSYDELTDFPGYSAKTLKHTLMTGLETETVVKAAESLYRRAIGSGDRNRF